MADLSRVDVIAPNFKRRLSGVTATVARLVPLQAKSIAITTCAPDMPIEVPNVHWAKLITMSRRKRVWHARRNVEMIAGLALKTLLRKKLKLLFTSASQRQHTWLTRALVARMDAIIATSSKTASYLERPSKVVLHGIDTHTFTPHADRRSLRHALGLPADGPLIGCFGRIRAQKGTDVFVDAMIAICQMHPNANAIIMGRATAKDEAYLKGLQSKIDKAQFSGRIRFLPEVPVWEIAKYYQALDLYVAPQRWEGFGLTPLEAMATGCPVIATRVGAFEELVPPQAGQIIDPGDVQKMIDACNRLLEADAQLGTLRAAARKHVEDHFTLESEADAIIAIYRQLLAT